MLMSAPSSTRNRGFLKVARRALLDLLSSKQGTALLVISALFIILAALQLAQSIVAPYCYNGCALFDFKDNLAGKSFQDRMCLGSFDIVYTWVNGSDPKLREDIAKYRELFNLEHGIGVNHTDDGENKTQDTRGGTNRYRGKFIKRLAWFNLYFR
jgi:UDP-N-acetylglucosamine-lysosomal-enzyme